MVMSLAVNSNIVSNPNLIAAANEYFQAAITRANIRWTYAGIRPLYDDGASKAQTLFKVIIPNVMPSITICTFLTLTNGFKLFDQNLALTGGLPYTQLADGSTINTTEMMALNIYNTFYMAGAANRGVAQAKAVIFCILVAAMGLTQLKYNRSREVQQ